MIRAVLIDLSGTIHIENEAIPGAVEALKRLYSKNLHVKFVTNTTKESQNILYDRLKNLGFSIEKQQIHTSLVAARNLLKQECLKPLYLIAKEALEDFEDIPTPKEGEDPNAVVVGLAPDEFNYERLNVAFRALLEGAKLIAVHAGRYYKRKDGLALGPGPFVKGLEYAAGCEAQVVGKPSQRFFLSAIEEFKEVPVNEIVMIGDDVNDDIKGSMSCGMKGCLVKTGKYRVGDEAKITPPPTYCVPSFKEAVDEILKELDNKIY